MTEHKNGDIIITFSDNERRRKFGNKEAIVLKHGNNTVIGCIAYGSSRDHYRPEAAR